MKSINNFFSKYFLKISFSFAILLLLCSMQVNTPKKVVFFGDSITRQAIDSAGFITLINKQMKAEGIANNYELIGAGVSGNKIYDLYFRFQKDVLDKNPDVVVIYIGVNDVWHKSSFGTGTDPNRFVSFYTAMITKLKETNVKVILCTPAVIGEKNDFVNPQDGDLNAYAQIVRDLAKQYNCDLVDLRKLFIDYNKINNTQNQEKGILTKDRVHLNEKGNQIVCDQLYKLITK